MDECNRGVQTVSDTVLEIVATLVIWAVPFAYRFGIIGVELAGLVLLAWITVSVRMVGNNGVLEE